MTTLATRVVWFIIRFLIKFNVISILFNTEFCHWAEPLFKKFSSLITYRGKPRSRVKKRNSNFSIKLIFGLLVLLYCALNSFSQNCMVNKLEYGVQISSFHASFLVNVKRFIALKNQVEKCFLNETSVNKPFW